MALKKIQSDLAKLLAVDMNDISLSETTRMKTVLLQGGCSSWVFQQEGEERLFKKRCLLVFFWFCQAQISVQMFENLLTKILFGVVRRWRIIYSIYPARNVWIALQIRKWQLGKYPGEGRYKRVAEKFPTD